VLALGDGHLLVVLELAGRGIEGGLVVVQGRGGAQGGDGDEVRGGDEADLRRRGRVGVLDLDLVPAASEGQESAL